MQTHRKGCLFHLLSALFFLNLFVSWDAEASDLIYLLMRWMSDWDNKIVFTFPFAMNFLVCVLRCLWFWFWLYVCLCWRGGCDTLSEGVYVKYKSNLGFDDQPAAQAITSQTMGCNLQTSTLNTLQSPYLNFDLLFCFLLRGWYAHCCWYAQLLFSSSQAILFSSSWMICPTLNTNLETYDSCWYA